MQQQARGLRPSQCRLAGSVALRALTRRASPRAPAVRLVPSSYQNTDRVAALPAPSEPLIVTTFKWPRALGGHEVAVAGSFNGWGPPLPLGRTPGGDFVRSLALPAAGVQYKFLVDGEWMASPCEKVVYSGSSTVNNYRLVQPTAAFTWPGGGGGGAGGGGEVMLAGDWTCWAELLPMARDPVSGAHRLEVCLPPGQYQYQFLVDGQWRLCPDSPTTQREDGAFANSIEVRSMPAFLIFYATGWQRAVLHHPGWREVPMHHTPSRAHPKGGSWKTAVISAVHDAREVLNGNGAGAGASASVSVSASLASASALASLDLPAVGENGASASGGASEGEGAAGSGSGSDGEGWSPLRRSNQLQLEFYVSAGDGSGLEDRPPGGGAYRLVQPGGFKLRSGQLRPFPNATAPPMMLVSDLDNTMVGEGEDADGATAEFGAYWEENAALAGSMLVYNTGRSIGQFLGLLEAKAGALPVPDVVISAVGTKIFRLDTEGGTRSTASVLSLHLRAPPSYPHIPSVPSIPYRPIPGMVYHEDLQYSRTLDEGWDLAVARAAAGAVLDALPGTTAWLDDGSEHPHRIALSVRVDVLGEVVERLRAGCEAGGVTAQVITSGTHDWRYVDVVAARCVAAGDSGNDILMLGGTNPAVVVGNAQQELLDWVLQQESRLVVTDAPLARGILEGLARHGLY
eukprot:scaffold8.g1465.t1